MASENKKNEGIRVVVHYIAAGKPYEAEYLPEATLLQVKQDAMNSFHLTEGNTPEGNIVSYNLFHEKERLDDLSKTVGQIAGHQKVLQLKLAQQFTQG